MKKHLRIFALLLVVTLLAGCGSGGGSTPTPAGAPATETPAAETQGAIGGGTNEEGGFVRQTEEGTLTLGTPNATEGFDPASDNNGIGMSLVYETLFVYNPDTETLEPQLAESYEYLDDTTLQINLRKDATFSNGDPFTAEDVLFSLYRFIDVASNLSTYVDVYDYDNCEIVDDHTLILKYYEPYGPGVNYLSGQFKMLNKEYVESTDADAFWDAPVGTGPYAVVENVSGSHTTYALRDDYWGEAPEAKTITVRNYSESSTMFIDFENGELDLVIEVGTNDVNRLLADEVADCTYKIQSIRDVYMLCLSEYVEYFQDVRVRQAIAHALNVEEIADVALDSLALEATSVLPEGVAFKIDLDGYEYNPELSKELLAEAGYPDGFELNMVITQDPVSPIMAEAIQFYLEQVGIKLNIQAYDFPTAIPMFMAGETDMCLKNAMGGATLGEPDQILDTLKASSTNAAIRISDPEMDGYLMNGLYTIDEDARRENYENAQKWVYENVTNIPICEAAKCFAYRNYLSLKTNSVQYPDLTFVHFN